MAEGVTNRRKKGRGADGATESPAHPQSDRPAEGGTGEDALRDSIVAARQRTVQDPADVPARLELARLYREHGDTGLALEQLEAARAERPDDPEVLTELGIGLAARGRLMDAEKELRRAQRLAPDRPGVAAQLGVVLFKRGQYRQAEAELRRALELDDRNGDAYFYRGEALNQLGRVDEALEMLEKAVQLQPRNARAYYTMGILYDRKHLRQEATTMYRKAREVGAA